MANEYFNLGKFLLLHFIQMHNIPLFTPWFPLQYATVASFQMYCNSTYCFLWTSFGRSPPRSSCSSRSWWPEVSGRGKWKWTYCKWSPASVSQSSRGWCTEWNWLAPWWSHCETETSVGEFNKSEDYNHNYWTCLKPPNTFKLRRRNYTSLI